MLDKNLKESFDHIDIALFSGDSFHGYEAASYMKKFLSRWGTELEKIMAGAKVIEVTDTDRAVRIVRDLMIAGIECKVSPPTGSNNFYLIEVDHHRREDLHRIKREFEDPAISQVFDKARSLYDGDDISIDNYPMFSEADKGCWVSAWVWVEGSGE